MSPYYITSKPEAVHHISGTDRAETANDTTNDPLLLSVKVEKCARNPYVAGVTPKRCSTVVRFETRPNEEVPSNIKGAATELR